MQVGGVASSGYVYKYPHFPLVLYTLPLSGTSQRHAAATDLMLSAREGIQKWPMLKSVRGQHKLPIFSELTPQKMDVTVQLE